MGSPSGDEAARRRIAAAIERAKGAGRRVMVVFTGDWCGDSKALLAALEHPLVAPLVALGLEVVVLDAGNRDRHLALAEGWGLSYARGLPAVAVLDGDGELVAATRQGELASARLLSPIDVATLVHRWLPEGAGTAGG
jgi:thiol-disulfide isomerase/thioredoxin